jgi:hypothetical protein
VDVEKSNNCLKGFENSSADNYININVQGNIGYCLKGSVNMKTTTPSFILELPLDTNTVQEGLNCLDLIRQSKDFQEIQKLPKTIDGEPNKEITEAFKELNKKYEFTDYEILSIGTRIKTEDVSYKGWQKRYCRSINMRATSMFMNI